tara:strand:- start:54350 stop:56527 length:2178 start_codon:yes stop_codon:yes gene_type:complete
MAVVSSPQRLFSLSAQFFLAAFLMVGLGACVVIGDDDVVESYKLVTLSGRPEMVTGGDALIEVIAPKNQSLSELRLTLNGVDVTSQFRSDGAGLVGLLETLEPTNEVRLLTSDGTNRATLFITNHPIEGPVFSGPHETPFMCETDAFTLLSGETLGAPISEDCSIKRRVDYGYRSTQDGELKPLLNIRTRPEDLATTTTLSNAEVPYIVRIETGTINRAIYQIAVLHDPVTDSVPDPWTPPSGWNGRLIYTFGGGCVNGWFRQGARTGGVTDDVMLRQGYAVASSSLNVFANNCNDLLAAETMMMVKERFIEAFGNPRHTIGWGCSGGSYQNHQIADNYPGLLDGIIPGCSFPDVGFSTIPMITDARLLNHYFTNKGFGTFSEAEQQAVAGFLALETMSQVSVNAGRVTVGEFCPDALPEIFQYHATDNPSGARCDVYEHYVNVYGRDPDTGFARRALDNIGVQYGLEALNAGVITMAQFLDLNEGIGGYDGDGRFHASRTEADLEAIRTAYETGRLTNGGGGLAVTPIIDYRAYSDDREGGDVHTRYHSFSMRERLKKANGRTDNHVMLVEDMRYGLYNSESPVLSGALLQMDRWLENISADASSDPLPDKISRAKPDDLTDTCWSRDTEPVKIVETQIRGKGRCEDLYPSSPSPREVAGAPLASDIIKCQVKPVELSDYPVGITASDQDRLRMIFPEGVCDWSKLGVGQTGLKGTWLSFGEGT